MSDNQTLTTWLRERLVGMASLMILSLAHTRIAEHSHTNPEHNGPEAVRAYYPCSMSMIYAKRGII